MNRLDYENVIYELSNVCLAESVLDDVVRALSEHELIEIVDYLACTWDFTYSDDGTVTFNQ